MISIAIYLLLRYNIKVIKIMEVKMGIIIQVLGSLLILIGFVFSQLGKLKTTSLNYLLLNAIGALILGIDAFIGKQWGFVLLEGVWSIVAIQGLFKYFNKKEVK
jgi:putative permease